MLPAITIRCRSSRKSPRKSCTSIPRTTSLTRQSWASPTEKSKEGKTGVSYSSPLVTRHAATARIQRPSCGSNTWRSYWENQRTKQFEAARGLGRRLAGADFLPATRALVGLQDFFAQTNRFRCDLHEFVVRNKLDSLLQAQLAVRNQADGFVRAG